MNRLLGSIGIDGTFRPRAATTLAVRDFPAWHFPMVNDVARNTAIEAAIARLDLQGATVIEIGSGTGLIALLFAKYGARRVVTCEMNTSLALTARQIIATTEYADRIEIVNDSSSNAIQRGELPREPHVIFTETLDCGVVGEGFFDVARDIRALAGPRTIILPTLIEQSIALVQSDEMANLNRAGLTCGFDLSALNTFSTATYFPVRSELYQLTQLTEPAPYRSYRYLHCETPDVRQLSVVGDGHVHGVLSWFTADFGGATASNAPRMSSHWHQAFHPLPTEIRVRRGDTVSVLIDDEGCASVHVGRPRP